MKDIANEYFNVVMKQPVPEPREYINNMISLWEKVKDNYLEVFNTHLIVNDIIIYSLKIGDLNLAEKRAKNSLGYEGNTYLLGEGYFALGEVMYAKGDMEKAKEYFTKVYENSKSRLFKGKNPEYLKLIGKKI